MCLFVGSILCAWAYVSESVYWCDVLQHGFHFHELRLGIGKWNVYDTDVRVHMFSKLHATIVCMSVGAVECHANTKLRVSLILFSTTKGCVQSLCRGRSKHASSLLTDLMQLTPGQPAIVCPKSYLHHVCAHVCGAVGSVSGPGITPNSTLETVASHVDLSPTFLGLAGLSTPSTTYALQSTPCVH